MDVQDFNPPNKMRRLLGKFTVTLFDLSLITTHISLSDKIPARVVLYFLSWSGFLVSFVMRNDINLAIVEMVKNPSTADPDGQNSTGFNSTESPLFDDPADDDKFDWSNSVQSFIVSSFYLFYVVSQVQNLQSSYFIPSNSS